MGPQTRPGGGSPQSSESLQSAPSVGEHQTSLTCLLYVMYPTPYLQRSLSGATCIRVQSQLRAARPGGGAGGAAGDSHQEASQEQVTS